MTSVGQRIRHYRQQACMTQEAVSLDAGLHAPGVISSTLSDFERDKRTPAPEELSAIARALGVPYRVLAGDDPYYRHAPKNPDTRAAAIGRVIRALRLERGWTQQALAYHAYCHIYSLRAWELGQRHPRDYMLNAVLDALSVSPATFWQRVGDAARDGKAA